jgi:hypothetical protein
MKAASQARETTQECRGRPTPSRAPDAGREDLEGLEPGFERVQQVDLLERRSGRAAARTTTSANSRVSTPMYGVLYITAFPVVDDEPRRPREPAVAADFLLEDTLQGPDGGVGRARAAAPQRRSKAGPRATDVLLRGRRVSEAANACGVGFPDTSKVCILQALA